MARIALVSDITPVPLTAGPMVLYRHFVRLRGHELLVVSGEIPEPDPPDRHWEVVRLPRRLRPLRRPLTWVLFEEMRCWQIVAAVRERVRAFRPDVIVSVWASEYVLAGARLATHFDVPLVLICHDDLQRMLPSFAPLQLWASCRLGSVYRAAAARLCVSPALATTLEHRYGAPATIMYPIPDASAPPYDRYRIEAGGGAGVHPLRLGFCGNVGGGNAAVLLALADVLADRGGQLHLTSASSGPERTALRQHYAVRDCGFLPTLADVRRYFQSHVDAMVVPQSFMPVEAKYVRANFPSKLPESLHFGLPLLLVAPPYASAVQWLEGHAGVAVACTRLQPEAIAAALTELERPEQRRELAIAARRAAAVEFDPEVIHGVLESTLDAVEAAGRANRR